MPAWIPQRRWLRVRLTTLLLLTTAACMVLAFRATYLQPYVRQAQAVKTLVKAGARVDLEKPTQRWLSYFLDPQIYHHAVRVDGQLPELQDAHLAALPYLRHLRELDLAHNPLTDQGMRHLLQTPGVERLSLANTAITDKTLEYLLNMENLSTLDLHETAVTDQGMKSVARLKNLKHLRLSQRITDKGLEQLKALRQLQSLDLSETWATSAGFQFLQNSPIEAVVPSKWQERLLGKDLVHLRNWRHLRKLPGAVIEARDADLAHLANLSIQSLTISGSELSDGCVSHLNRIPNLKLLNLSGQISPAGISKLSQMGLLSLKITTPAITFEDVEELASAPPGHSTSVFTPWLTSSEISSLNSRFNNGIHLHSNVFVERANGSGDPISIHLQDPITEIIHDWQPLLRWHNLEHLQLRFQQYGRFPIDVVEQLTNLQSVGCHHGQLLPSDIEQLIKLPRLESLQTSNTVIAPQHLEPMFASTNMQLSGAQWPLYYFQLARDSDRDSTASDGFPWPTHISFSDPQDESIRSLMLLKDVVESLEVTLSHTRPSTDLSPLAQLPNLHFLRISNSLLTDSQWKQIWASKGLQYLKIENSYLTDQEIDGIESLKNLQTLYLNNVQITDKGMQAVSRLHQLSRLSIDRAKRYGCGPYVTGSGLAALSNAKALKHQKLSRMNLEGKSLLQWNRFKNLESLHVTGCRLSNEPLLACGELSTLNEVTFDDCTLPDLGWTRLLDNPALRHVSLWEAKLSEKSYRLFRQRESDGTFSTDTTAQEYLK